MNTSTRNFFISLIIIALAAFALHHGFVNFRQGDNDTAYLGLVVMSFGILALSFSYSWPFGFSWKRALIRTTIVIVVNALLIAILFAVYPIPAWKLNSAISTGNNEKVRKILDKYPASMSVGYNEDHLTIDNLESGLNSAVELGNWQMVELFLEYKVDLNNFHIVYRDYTSPLETAIAMGSIEAYEKLISLGANPELRQSQQLSSAIPWHNEYDRNMLEYLLQQGLNPNTPLNIGYHGLSTGLHGLVSSLKYKPSNEKIWEAIRILIRYGANINLVDDNGYTPFLYAENKEVEGRLVEMGALWIERNSRGLTALHHAVKEQNLTAVKQILNTDPILLEIGDNDGIRPLYQGCLQYSPHRQGEILEIIEYLLKAGADPDARQRYNWSSLLGLEWRHGNALPAAVLLIKYGADINIEREGVNVLQTAAEYGYVDAVEFLLSNGAKPSEAVLNFAESNGYVKEISRLIVKYKYSKYID